MIEMIFILKMRFALIKLISYEQVKQKIFCEISIADML